MPRERALSHLLVAGRPDLRCDDRQALEQALADMLAGARRAWPGVQVEDEVFVAYLAERIPRDGDALSALAGMQVSDLYLACACAGGSPAALSVFETSCFPVMESALRRVPRLASMSDDARQLLRQKLFVGRDGASPKITEYSGRSPLGTWLRVVASRVALDLLRKTRAGDVPDDDGFAQLAAPMNDPELAYLKERYRQELASAFQQAIAALSVRERNLLRQHHVDGLTLEELAELYRLHRVSVARRLRAIRDKLGAETRRLLLLHHGIGRDDLESLLWLLSSQFHVSVRRLLDGESSA